jgi:hypothetical protein
MVLDVGPVRLPYGDQQRRQREDRQTPNRLVGRLKSARAVTKK